MDATVRPEPGSSLRHVRALFDTVKVVEYERGDAVVRQTTELRDDVEALLLKLQITAPPRYHGVQAAPAAPVSPEARALGRPPGRLSIAHVSRATHTARVSRLPPLGSAIGPPAALRDAGTGRSNLG